MAVLFQQQKFKGLWYRRRLQDDPDELSDLSNLRTTPEGHLRIRAGVQKVKPSGGSWSDITSMLDAATTTGTAKAVGGMDRRTPWPVILTKTAAGVLSEDKSQQAWAALFTASAVNERHIVVSPGGPFSTIIYYVGRANVSLTLAWYYVKSDGTEVALPGVSEQFTGTGEIVVRFAPPSDWGGYYFNGYYGFGIVCKVTVVGGGPVIPRIAQKRITGDMPGHRTLVLGYSDTLSAAASAAVMRYAPTTALASQFAVVDNNAAAYHDAGNDAPMCMASHDGAFYWTNGFKQRRWQGDPALNADLGFTKPSTTGFAAAAAGGLGAGQLSGVFLYAVSYGYGPNGAWGKSQPIVYGTAASPAAQRVDVTFPTEITGLSSGIVDVVYIYRSWDLTGASANAYNNIPLYQVAAVTRQDSDGTWANHSGGAVGYTDNVAAWPFPMEQMDFRDRTPPARSRFLCFHKNRMILASNREHPARVWPSLAGEYEAFDQFSGNGHQDFTSGGGDEITGLADFNDMLIVFTNRGMYAMLNLDTDDWSSITLHPELGCIAPWSIQVGFGYLWWLGQRGVWRWNGTDDPENIGWPLRMDSMSGVVHGMSRAGCYDDGYEIELIPQDRSSTYATAWPQALYGRLWTKYHFSNQTKEWSPTEFSNGKASYMQLICTAQWPHGTDYDGRSAPVYANHRVGNADGIRVWMGEASGTDDGTNITWSMGLPYGPWKAKQLVPERIELLASNVSGNPAASITSVTTIGEKPSVQATPTADGASTLTSYQWGFTRSGTGCGDLGMGISGTADSSERACTVYGVFFHGKLNDRKAPL
jgi:hypothetical protein